MKSWIRTSLIDFNDNVTSVLFYGGCRFRCPYCHNKELVLIPDSMPNIDPKEVLTYLRAKKNLYDGVCISGGEPTLQSDLKSVIEEIKAIGLKVKLDTNGSQFEVLKNLIDSRLLDYVAMDIKTTWDKYKDCCPEELIDNVKASVNLLKYQDLSSVSPLPTVDYEFRSTAYPPYFEDGDLEKIAEIVEGAPGYYLQKYNYQNTLSTQALRTTFTDLKMEELKTYFSPFVGFCEIR